MRRCSSVGSSAAAAAAPAPGGALPATPSGSAAALWPSAASAASTSGRCTCDAAGAGPALWRGYAAGGAAVALNALRPAPGSTSQVLRAAGACSKRPSRQGLGRACSRIRSATLGRTARAPPRPCSGRRKDGRTLPFRDAPPRPATAPLPPCNPPSGSNQVKRVGRGNGNGRGTYCGHGMNGQKSRGSGKPGILFDGGQKSLRKLPKVGATPT
jgi:hypothetical protein